MKKSILFLAFVLSAYGVYSQSAMMAYVGLTQGQNSFSEITTPNSRHYGYVVGVDVRFPNDGTHFLLSGQYKKLSYQGLEEAKYFGHVESFELGKFGFGLGSRHAIIKNKLGVRLKAQGSLLYIFNSTDGSNLNEATASIDVGVGLDFWLFGLDFTYERGIVNAYHQVPDSKFNFYNLTLGFQF